MQAAAFFDDALAWTHIQMIGIGEYYLSAELLDLIRRKRLDRRLRAYGHEYGRFDNAVRRGEFADARARLLAYMYFLKRELFLHLFYLWYRAYIKRRDD